MEFEIWHIWLIAAIFFFILEIIIPSFVIFNFGVGALFGTIAATASMSIEWQIFVFSLFTIASFFLIRPILLKWAYKRSHSIKTNTEAYIGRQATVEEEINPIGEKGTVKLDGSVWQARTSDGSIIKTGKIVEITKVDSIVFEVKSVM